MAKIRTGFVSNSSSSSFIIGIANATKAGRDDLGVEFNLKDTAFSKYHNSLIWSPPGSGYPEITVRNKEDKFLLEIESFMYTSVSCEAVEGDKILYLDSYGPEGDEFFTIYDDDGEYIDMDYDKIDLEDFNEEDREIFSTIFELGGQATFGAGRNG
jgi:hypothetical protein